MKLLLPSLLVLSAWLAACRSEPSRPPLPALTTPSGLEEVTILAKGLE